MNSFACRTLRLNKFTTNEDPPIINRNIVDDVRRDRMTQLETIEQRVCINTLGFNKTNSWFEEVQQFLEKSEPQKTAFLNCRLAMRQQQHTASFLKKAKTITKQMGWNELAENINDKRSLKNLCKLCFICSQ
eukprot:3213211-Rhodomonas_salina.3